MEVVGTHAEHLLKVCRGSVKIFNFVAQQAAVEERTFVVWFQLERVIIVRHGAEKVIEVIADESAVHIEVGFLRPEIHGLVHVGERFLPFFSPDFISARSR